MTTITLQVSDNLAQRLAERDDLPQILEWALDAWRAPRLSAPSPFAEMVEFLATHPTAPQILAFKISPASQARLALLLDKNREEGLSNAEHAELDWYEYVHEIMTRLKAHARPPAVS